MKKYWILTAIILLLAIVSIILFYTKRLSVEELSAFGSIFAAAGGFIAVIWFYNSLQQQTIQLKEQRQQFQLEFNNLRLEGKRNVIALAKSMLKDMHTEVNEQLKDNGKIENLPALFLTKAFPLIAPITQSKNEETVLDAIEKFNSIFVPAKTFLSSLKEVGILFLENEGTPVISDKNQPEWFILTYQEKLENISFISTYMATAIQLAEIIVRIKLKVVFIATETALALINPTYMKEDEIFKDVKNYKEENSYLPKIAEKWLEAYQGSK